MGGCENVRRSHEELYCDEIVMDWNIENTVRRGEIFAIDLGPDVSLLLGSFK